MPLCYNGDLVSMQDIDTIKKTFPGVDSVMVGRGLIADPGMLTGGTSREVLKEFCDVLLETYIREFGGARNAMFRMKEHWRHLVCKFDNAEKLSKQLRKTTDLQEFIAITHRIFLECPMRSTVLPAW